MSETRKWVALKPITLDFRTENGVRLVSFGTGAVF
jgi:hypothetical protein